MVALSKYPGDPVAYLGFQKGGAKFSLAASAHTKGAKPSFPIFLVCEKKNFWPKGGHGPMAPPKYATARGVYTGGVEAVASKLS